ncbi:MAG: hypothetical protein WC539_10100 [Nitrospirota bacterium]
MKPDASFKKNFCKEFCFYAKSGVKETIFCKGYRIVERLLEKGKKLVIKKRDRPINAAVADAMTKKMCVTCDFYDHDCDFMQDRNAPPCGGFLFLAQLIESGSITLDDVC